MTHMNFYIPLYLFISVKFTFHTVQDNLKTVQNLFNILIIFSLRKKQIFCCSSPIGHAIPQSALIRLSSMSETILI